MTGNKKNSAIRYSAVPQYYVFFYTPDAIFMSNAVNQPA